MADAPKSVDQLCAERGIDARQLAVSLAGAFITSLLFVSAATSLPIA